MQAEGVPPTVVPLSVPSFLTVAASVPPAATTTAVVMSSPAAALAPALAIFPAVASPSLAAAPIPAAAPLQTAAITIETIPRALTTAPTTGSVRRAPVGAADAPAASALLLAPADLDRSYATLTSTRIPNQTSLEHVRLPSPTSGQLGLGDGSLPASVPPQVATARVADSSESDFDRDFAPYIVLSHLGRGGFGQAYLAYHRDRPDNFVVLKVPLRSATAARLLLAEASKLRSLHHPRIVSIFDFVEDRCFFVMEYVSGGSLANHLRSLPDSRVSAPKAAHLLLHTLEALEYVHLKNIVHLDVS